MWIEVGVIPVSSIVRVNEPVALTMSPVPDTLLPFCAVMAKEMGFGDAVVAALPPPQAAITTPTAMASTTLLIWGRLRKQRLVFSTPPSYA
jgi:hypothetical protein